MSAHLVTNATQHAHGVLAQRIGKIISGSACVEVHRVAMMNDMCQKEYHSVDGTNTQQQNMCAVLLRKWNDCCMFGCARGDVAGRADRCHRNWINGRNIVVSVFWWSPREND